MYFIKLQQKNIISVRKHQPNQINRVNKKGPSKNVERPIGGHHKVRG